MFVFAVVIALAFAVFTDQRWEDYYITFRVSKNLAHGLGPVFQPGERVHAFTSPLGMLLPALISWSTGGQADELSLWIFRVITIGAFGGAVAAIWSTVRKLGWSGFSSAIASGLLMTDAKSVSFSTNGMETAFVLLFLALAIRQLVVDSGSGGWRLGACWAGLMWTRPDGFVLFGSLAAGWLLFAAKPRVAGGRVGVLREYFKAAIVCGVLYLPWFLWAWHYFGSPVPNTVVAKGLGRHFPGAMTLFGQLVTLPFRSWGTGKWDLILMPTYAMEFGGWPHFMAGIGRTLVAIGVLAFLLPRVDAFTRAISIALAVAVVYLLNIQVFPWYFPPVAMLALLAFAGVLEAAFKTIRPKLFPLGVGVVAVLFTASLLGASAWELRQQQRIVEGQRKAIGLWLKDHRSTPTDTVFLESLGYIGFYSQLKMIDYPGLSSPEMLAARRKFGEVPLMLVAATGPRWVVQRPGELNSPDPRLSQWFLDHYVPAKEFNVSAQIAAVGFLPGRPFLQHDQGFLVWRRKD